MAENRARNPPQLSVEDWRHIATAYRGPLTSTMNPLQVLLKAKLNTQSDREGRVLREQLQSLGERYTEASEKLLDFLLKEDNCTQDEVAARWQLFGNALEEVHPVLYDVITTHNSQGDAVQAQQKALMDFFTDDISKDVDPMVILPGLISNGLLGQIEREKVQSIYEREGATLSSIYMVCNIHRVNPNWYSLFLGVLVDYGYRWLVKILDPDAYHKKVEQPLASSSTTTDTRPEETPLNEYAAYRPRNPVSSLPSCGNSEGTRMQVFNINQLSSRENREISRQGQDEADTSESSRTQSTPPRNNEANSDSEEEEDFHSCDSSFDLEENSDLDLTKVKEVMTCTGGSPTPPTPQGEGQMSPRGSSKVVVMDSQNQERTQTEKELRDKNIFFPEAPQEIPVRIADNSNAEEHHLRREKAESDDDAIATLTLYDDQVELARDARAGKNVIIVAPTGSGKTYVAADIIKHHLEQGVPGVRKVVFLVNNRALAEQQNRLCFLKYLSNFRSKTIVGGEGSSERVELNCLLESTDILVMTAQILLNALVQKEIEGIHVFSLLVFDECHHTHLKHSYNCIMHHYMDRKLQGQQGGAGAGVGVEHPIQVVGLTASVGVGKARNPTEAEQHVKQLCAHLDAEYICTVQVHLHQLLARTKKPEPHRIKCGKRPDDKFQAMIESMMMKIEERIERSEYTTSDDTGGVLTRMRQKPQLRGSCQYTTWISELTRTVKLMKDGSACRALKPCCDMLNIYNDSLIINDECDTEDALEFLDQQMDKYDPTEQRNMDTDRFLHDLFDKNKPYLKVVSQEQANTNPKLLCMEEKLVKTFEENLESRVLVLVKTRDLAEALVKWMQRRPQLIRLQVKPEKMVGACAPADQGGMTDPQQRNVLQGFCEGRHNVLVATSIAEEGLRYPDCNLVMHYNHVTNEIAIIQARGRAQAEKSQFVMVADESQGVKQKAEQLDVRELMMEKAVTRVQAACRDNHEGFLQELLQIQQQEKAKRDAEINQHRNQLLLQEDVVFRCMLCDAFAFRLSDVRRIDKTHYVVIDLDYRHRYTEELHPPMQRVRVQNIGKVYCGRPTCKEYWGPMQVYRGLKFPCIKLEGFSYTLATGEKKVAKKWKQTQFVVEAMREAELEQYRRKAALAGLVFQG